MYALKQKAMQSKLYPEKFPIPVLAEEFFKMVKQNGRITESILVFKVFIKAMFSKMFGMQKLGLNLQRTGRFSLKTESMKRPKELRKLLKIHHSK